MPVRLAILALTFMFTSVVLADETPSAERQTHEAKLFDGRLFDPGVARTQAAESAPEQLALLAGLIGDWTVAAELHQPGPDGVKVTKSEARARITFMNRGHAIMERTRNDNFDGNGNRISTIAFLNVDSQGVWTVGEGNSWSESIRLYSGALEINDGKAKKLVVHDALRPGGGPMLLLFRRTYEIHGPDHLTMTQELSQDLGETWGKSVVRDYRRHAADSRFDPDFFPVREDVGQAAPGRPEEAAQFDFLLGEFDAKHWSRNPQGQERRWQSNATAVHALDGHAVLEFDSFDTDPNLPDAATSILRIYNRAMRRWENLFLPNRSHRPLYFGGVQEGDEIVLHLFGVNTGPGSVFRWIFYGVEKDSYLWRGLGSPDRGDTFQPNWTI
ncbi:MAG: DUF1579 domain-containing protein, partial [Thermoanaerobaculia bacterium]|nr:DUF1579 domain-containing protein [Thermoanaerobaculia bacterium]